MSKFKAFTFRRKEGGRLNALVTICGVSSAFDPRNGGKPPQIYQFNGLWDTGATGSVISQIVVDNLGLIPITKTKVYHTDGYSISDVYVINLILPNKVIFPLVKVTVGKLTGFDVLIGMDIINKGDFSITNVTGNTVFSFRYPSIKEVDYVKELKISEPESTSLISDKKSIPKVGRNEPCPCGNGKKYKQCHGKTS